MIFTKALGPGLFNQRLFRDGIIFVSIKFGPYYWSFALIHALDNLLDRFDGVGSDDEIQKRNAVHQDGLFLLSQTTRNTQDEIRVGLF